MEIEEMLQLTIKNGGKIERKENNQEKQMEINSNTEEEDKEATENLLKSYYEGFVNMNHPNYNTIKKSVEEDRVNLRYSIDCYNHKEFPTKSSNYPFIS